jgi:AraC-like DNA-binding protein
LVLLDQLVDVEVLPLRLTRPADPIASAAAEMLTADPGMSLDTVGDAVGASRRSLERRFVAGVGVSLGQWRQRVRLARALELLAAGESVTNAGAAVGYSTTSAFIGAFRRHFGATPSRYFATVGSA